MLNGLDWQKIRMFYEALVGDERPYVSSYVFRIASGTCTIRKEGKKIIIEVEESENE